MARRRTKEEKSIIEAFAMAIVAVFSLPFVLIACLFKKD